MLQILRQIKTRGDSAIVYDPAREFVQRFYDPKNGDVILNPLDTRCPYWGPAEELRRRSEAKALAVSLFQPPQDKKGEFFIESPQKIFAFLMAYGPTPEELVKWMSDPQEIDRRLKGTEHAHLIDPKAEHQRAGVLGSLGLVADSLRLLPKKGQGNGDGRPRNGPRNGRDGSSLLRFLRNAKPFVRFRVCGLICSSCVS